MNRQIKKIVTRKNSNAITTNGSENGVSTTDTTNTLFNPNLYRYSHNITRKNDTNKKGRHHIESIEEIDQFLGHLPNEEEHQQQPQELTTIVKNDDVSSIHGKSWSQLGKTEKLQKIDEFVAFVSEDQQYDEPKQKKLKQFLKECIQCKKITKQKDLVYSIKEERIISIPSLAYYPASKKFMLYCPSSSIKIGRAHV